ncbi:hypothetical protein OUZ56_029402 [Daphnia magna]|uniref:Uncharacterized protein n=1 Tax=Daphnia magna TaxID=35525 RepID=A0ABR0B6Q9_9CRUS|nr:hypothetical protein OUZ56_029402 [Daphnia magna]
MLVSCGVDNAVCAALLHKALLQGADSSRVVELSLTFRDLSTNVHDFNEDELKALGRELGQAAELLERHQFLRPGWLIRIIHVPEMLLEVDFDETKMLIQAKENVLLNRIEIATSEEEYLILEKLTSPNQYVFTLLPTRMVCVQTQSSWITCFLGTLFEVASVSSSEMGDAAALVGLPVWVLYL